MLACLFVCGVLGVGQAVFALRLVCRHGVGARR